MDLIIRRKAGYAIQEIFARYEGEQPGLGFEFLNCIEAATSAILRDPEASPTLYLQFRRRQQGGAVRADSDFSSHVVPAIPETTAPAVPIFALLPGV